MQLSLSYIIQVYLREMENQIGLSVFARNNVEPKFPHKEHVVGGVD